MIKSKSQCHLQSGPGYLYKTREHQNANPRNHANEETKNQKGCLTQAKIETYQNRNLKTYIDIS